MCDIVPKTGIRKWDRTSNNQYPNTLNKHQNWILSYKPVGKVLKSANQRKPYIPI